MHGLSSISTYVHDHISCSYSVFNSASCLAEQWFVTATKSNRYNPFSINSNDLPNFHSHIVPIFLHSSSGKTIFTEIRSESKCLSKLFYLSICNNTTILYREIYLNTILVYDQNLIIPPPPLLLLIAHKIDKL